jgi:hypothetical protein
VERSDTHQIRMREGDGYRFEAEQEFISSQITERS